MVRALLKSVGAAVALLAVLVLAVYLVSRWSGPTEAERQALALVDAPAQPPGRDGFAALYAVAHDIPPDRQAQVLAEDVRRFAASTPVTGASPGPGWRSAREDWPALVPLGSADPPWCGMRGSDCLDRVRARPQDYAGLLDRYGPAIDRAEALAAFDHFASPFPPRLDAPLPALQSMTWMSTRSASRFAGGEIDAGLAGACQGIAQGRRLVDAGDGLVGSMVGAVLVQGNATLLAQMLSELPREHPLPSACQAVAAPVDTAGGYCRAMLAEGRSLIGGMRGQIRDDIAAQAALSDLPPWAWRVLYDPERTAARVAPLFAWHCGEQARALVAADLPLVDTRPPASRRSLACVANVAGCILADIATPAYDGYGRRLQDADARLRATAALLWLRAQPGPMDAAALERLPAAMRSPQRPLRLDLQAATLGTTMYETPRGDAPRDSSWQVPLPGSRIQAAGASP